MYTTAIMLTLCFGLAGVARAWQHRHRYTGGIASPIIYHPMAKVLPNKHYRIPVLSCERAECHVYGCWNVNVHLSMHGTYVCAITFIDHSISLGSFLLVEMETNEETDVVAAPTTISLALVFLCLAIICYQLSIFIVNDVILQI